MSSVAKPNTVEVHNLKDLGFRATYSGITPRQAVMAAYAQDLKDLNTWDYERRYGHLTKTGMTTVRCGDFCALIERSAA